MSYSYASVVQMKKMLGNLEGWLDKAAKHAAAKGFDPNVLLAARLAPDQFAFARQVQSSCDNAKFAAARLAGKDAPSHADTEKTIDDLKARARVTIEYLDSFKTDDFAGAEARVIAMPRREGKVMKGSDYLVEYALPNFYFHVTTTYAILRHNGVDLGKADYLGAVKLGAPGSV